MADSRRGRSRSVRLTDAEYSAVLDAAELAGMTAHAWLRLMVLSALGRTEEVTNALIRASLANQDFRDQRERHMREAREARARRRKNAAGSH